MTISCTILTQEQWYKKVRSFLPDHYFDEVPELEDYLQAMAAAFYALQTDECSIYFDTFIEYAVGDLLDQYGKDRSVFRLPGEFDAQFRDRVRNIGNQSSCPALKRLIDLVLINGEATIIEDEDLGIYANRENFLDRGELLVAPLFNGFSVIVDNQKHDPYSFCDVEYFCDREDFVGETESSQYVFDLIMLVLQKRYCGTLYRVIERVE